MKEHRNERAQLLTFSADMLRVQNQSRLEAIILASIVAISLSQFFLHHTDTLLRVSKQSNLYLYPKLLRKFSAEWTHNNTLYMTTMVVCQIRHKPSDAGRPNMLSNKQCEKSKLRITFASAAHVSRHYWPTRSQFRGRDRPRVPNFGLRNWLGVGQ